MTTPRTIDNLGPEASTRYAEDRKNLDTKLLTDASKIPGQTRVDVVTLSYASELETLLGSQSQNPSFAAFYAPAGFGKQQKRLFTDSLIPSLGSRELREAQAQRIKTRIPPNSTAPADIKLSERWEEVREREDEEKEQKALLSLLDCVNLREKDLIDINVRRNQYQRG